MCHSFRDHSLDTQMGLFLTVLVVMINTGSVVELRNAVWGVLFVKAYSTFVCISVLVAL